MTKSINFCILQIDMIIFMCVIDIQQQQQQCNAQAQAKFANSLASFWVIEVHVTYAIHSYMSCILFENIMYIF